MGRHHVLKPHHLYISPSTHSSHPIDHVRTSYSSPSAFLQSSSSSALSVGGRIPGFKISAAFLSSLHSNIFIEVDSIYDSPVSTPRTLHPFLTDTPASSLTSFMSPLANTNAGIDGNDSPTSSESATAKEGVDDEAHPAPVVGLDNALPLSTFAAEDEDSRAEALHIVADSVAQQRDIASRSVMLHPITLAVFTVLVGWFQHTYNKANTDWVKVGMALAGAILALLGAVRLVCGPYIFEAERIGTWRWLNKGRSAEEEEEAGLRVLGTQDDVLLMKSGEEVVGAIIFRGIQPITGSSLQSGSKRSRRTLSASKQTRMIIRAWSVRQRHRRKEVGSKLLEDAIQSARAKGWTTEGVEFAEDHANHKRVLPAIFNGPLDKFTNIAQQTLDKKVHELGLGQEKGRRRK